MPRPLRPIGDRLVYHVINRGNNRAPVFHTDGDYAAFLDALRDLKRTRPFEFYGYCLMPNHVHLLIRTLDAPISRLMQSLLVSHTQRYHRCHRTSGHLWQGRFKSPVIQDDDHLLTVLRYIEANPLRARLAPTAGDYPWSSFPEHGAGHPSGLLDPVIAYEELAADPAERCRRWSAFVHQAPPDDELAGKGVRPEKGSELFVLHPAGELRILGAMPRPLRPIGDRLVYHVINRGNNRAPVFHTDGDYAAFLDALRDLKRTRPFEFFGYCLMPNHVHLLIRTLDVPISRLMQAGKGVRTISLAFCC